MDRIPYEELVQLALREVVVKEALRIAARDGLPGENHFYIAFRTKAAGVILPPSLLAQYPEQMTIVLQHRFWDLEVGDTNFSVTLTFGGSPAHITIPFGAIVLFRDPSAELDLNFVPTVEELRAVEPIDENAKPEEEAEAKPETPEDEDAGEAEVLSLDQFRRK